MLVPVYHLKKKKVTLDIIYKAYFIGPASPIIKSYTYIYIQIDKAYVIGLLKGFGPALPVEMH